MAKWFFHRISLSLAVNANRGADIEDNANHYVNRIREKFGAPGEIREQVTSPTVRAPGDQYVYTFHCHDRTHHKNFYTAFPHGGGEGHVVEITYSVK